MAENGRQSTQTQEEGDKKKQVTATTKLLLKMIQQTKILHHMRKFHKG